tara:strand:+ start:2664 stop:5336 length:2673 start_codon:yes stop_codon:yes gene_type:complete
MRNLLVLLPLISFFLSACLPIQKESEEISKATITTVVKAQKVEYPYRPSETRIFDLIHTDLDVRPNWENQTLEGVAELTLKPYFYSSDKLVLDAKGMVLSNVSLKIKNRLTPLKYEYDSLQLHIQLNREYTNQDTILIQVGYTAFPNKLSGNGSKAINDDKGLYFINPHGRDQVKPRQLWTQGETEASSCWFPTIDAPNEKCTQKISISVDTSLITLSNGTLTSSIIKGAYRTDTWEQKQPHAPYLFMMTVGNFAVIKDSWNGMPVHYYVPEKDSSNARGVFGNTPEMLSFYSDKLGYPYPWDKYHQVVVSDYVSGAMENTGAVIHGKWVFTSAQERIDYNNEDVIAHELFHHWFGDLVTCESWSNLALNESFATYGEYLWLEYKYGRYRADKQLRGDYLAYLPDTPRVNLIRYHYDHREDMFDRHSYQKGGRILHMLRNLVGDDAFFASLKLYLNNRAFKTAEVHDLRMAFEEVSGQDLNWFFNQWFLDKGHPVLEVNWNHLGDSLILNVAQVQSLNHPTFKLPVDVDVYFGGKVKRKKIWITKRKESFVFNGSGGADAVNFDADKVLLMELNQTLTPEEAIVLFKESDNYRTKLEAMLQVNNDTSLTTWELYRLASKDNFDSFRKLSVYFSTNMDYAKTEENKSYLLEKYNTDSSSSVRVAIVSSLYNIWRDDSSLLSFYKKALTDSSVNVKLTALDIIDIFAREDALLRAYELEKEKDPRIIRYLSRMYSTVKDESKTKWFNWAIKQVESGNKSYVISKYSNYLLEKDNEVVWKVCKKLKEEAIYENNKDVRYTAAVAIHKLRERNLKRIEGIRKDIVDKKEASLGKSYDLKLLKEKHQELLNHDKRMEELIKAIYNLEINKNIREKYESRGLLNTELPLFKEIIEP